MGRIFYEVREIEILAGCSIHEAVEAATGYSRANRVIVRFEFNGCKLECWPLTTAEELLVEWNEHLNSLLEESKSKEV